MYMRVGLRRWAIERRFFVCWGRGERSSTRRRRWWWVVKAVDKAHASRGAQRHYALPANVACHRITCRFLSAG